MSEELRSILIGTAGVSLSAAVAVGLTLARAPLSTEEGTLRAAARAGVVVVLLQASHFTEELATGFSRAFPEQLGLTPWPPAFFVLFNLFWLAAWGLASRGLVARSRLSLAALWFLGIAAVANGVAHPLLAARAAAYFPGLFTSPFLGLGGLLLLRRLAAATRGPAPSRAPPGERGSRTPA